MPNKFLLILATLQKQSSYLRSGCVRVVFLKCYRLFFGIFWVFSLHFTLRSNIHTFYVYIWSRQMLIRAVFCFKKERKKKKHVSIEIRFHSHWIRRNRISTFIRKIPSTLNLHTLSNWKWDIYFSLFLI